MSCNDLTWLNSIWQRRRIGHRRANATYLVNSLTVTRVKAEWIFCGSVREMATAYARVAN